MTVLSGGRDCAAGARSMPVRVLIRHADAGLRSAWGGPDQWRGLSPLGHTQAAAVVHRLAGLPILRVLSSPSLRCRQTVVPLAQELSLEVEACQQLAPHAELTDLLRLLADAETASAVLCTHRETLQMLFGHLAPLGVGSIGGMSPMGMAAAWTLHGAVDGPRPIQVHYLPLPAVEPVLR